MVVISLNHSHTKIQQSFAALRQKKLQFCADEYFFLCLGEMYIHACDGSMA